MNECLYAVEMSEARDRYLIRFLEAMRRDRIKERQQLVEAGKAAAPGDTGRGNADEADRPQAQYGGARAAVRS